MASKKTTMQGYFRANLPLQGKWAGKLTPKTIKRKEDASGTQIADTAPKRTARRYKQE